MSENVNIGIQGSCESNIQPDRGDNIRENANPIEDNVINVEVHSIVSELSAFIMSLITSTPNVDIKYVEKIFLEKVINNIFERRNLIQPVNEINDTFTALHAACLLNNLELVKLFVDHGLSVNAQTDNGLCPMHVILNKSEIDTRIVDCLINHGADLMLKDSESQTPLYIAVKMSHVAAVRIILQHPCDIDALCGPGVTALMTAASNGDVEIVNLLLANCADPCILNTNEGFMAIHFSVMPGNKDTFKRLLEVADWQRIRNCEPYISLMEIIIDRECTDCLEVLSESAYREETLLKETYDIQLGMNSKICGKYKKSCLIGYMFLGVVVSMDSVEAHKEMFDVIIKMGLPANSLSADCIPPLTAAIVANSELLLDEPEYYIEKLIHHGADVNYPQADAPEALLCSLTNHQIILLLLQHSNFATPDSVLNGYVQMDGTSNISSEVIHLFLKLGMTPSTVNLLSALPFFAQNISDYNALTQNVCSLKQLCRISLRHLFYLKCKDLSIKEILKNLPLPDGLSEYLRYEIL